MIDNPSPNPHRRENTRDDQVRGTAGAKQQGDDDDAEQVGHDLQRPDRIVVCDEDAKELLACERQHRSRLPASNARDQSCCGHALIWRNRQRKGVQFAVKRRGNTSQEAGFKYQSQAGPDRDTQLSCLIMRSIKAVASFWPHLPSEEGLSQLACGTALVMNARGLSSYDEAINSTWRHSDSTDLPSSSARRELVRYATLAAKAITLSPGNFGSRIAPFSCCLIPGVACPPSIPTTTMYLPASAAPSRIWFKRLTRSDFGRFRATTPMRAEYGSTWRPHRRNGQGLFGAIPRRQSTRALYDGRSVPPEHLRLLETAGNGEGVRMLLFTERQQREEILSYLVAGNSAQMDDVAFVEELELWILFSYGEALSTRDGLFSEMLRQSSPAGLDRPFDLQSGVHEER